MKTVNWVVVCLVTDEKSRHYAKHMVCYENEPTEAMLVELVKELYVDEDLGMAGLKVNEDYKLFTGERNAPDLKEWFDQVGVPSELKDL